MLGLPLRLSRPNTPRSRTFGLGSEPLDAPQKRRIVRFSLFRPVDCLLLTMDTLMLSEEMLDYGVSGLPSCDSLTSRLMTRRKSTGDGSGWT